MNILLPTPPILPTDVMAYSQISPQDLIALNGNHWRKILTILAKLCAKADKDWRIVRDQELWQHANLYFDPCLLPDQLLTDTPLLVVGKTFYEAMPVPKNAVVLGNDRHIIYQTGNTYWTPYLDYRQFPNHLIDTLKNAFERQETEC